MNKEEYLLLYKKYLSGECTEQEKKMLGEYSDDFNLSDHPWIESEMGDQNLVKNIIYNRLQDSIESATPATMISIRTLMKIAATILIFLSAVLYTRFYDNTEEVPLTKQQKSTGIDTILPGGNKAVLTLANGTQVVLETEKKGVLAGDDRSEFKKVEDGKLVYSSDYASSSVNNVEYNTITTPAGGQYEITLPDGTRVWLNAASSLSFPSAFTTAERKVKLVGEAYFEVAKNKDIPFKVLVNDTEIKVLGTHFNISGYNDERNIKTTLLEGAVKVLHKSAEAILKPGQQAISTESNMRVAQVDVNEAIAWKEGLFMFDNEDIGTVMRKISRWYNVDIVYKGKIPEKDLSGTVSRFESISEVLELLELTGIVHFKIEGRRIIVMP